MPTLSIIKVETRGFVGHTAVHPEMVAEASRAIDRAWGNARLSDRRQSLDEPSVHETTPPIGVAVGSSS